MAEKNLEGIKTNFNQEDVTVQLIIRNLVEGEEFKEGEYVLKGYVSRPVVNNAGENLVLSVCVVKGEDEDVDEYLTTTSELVATMLDDYNTYIGKFPVKIRMNKVQAKNGVAKRISFMPNK